MIIARQPIGVDKILLHDATIAQLNVEFIAQVLLVYLFRFQLAKHLVVCRCLEYHFYVHPIQAMQKV